MNFQVGSSVCTTDVIELYTYKILSLQNTKSKYLLYLIYSLIK